MLLLGLAPEMCIRDSQQRLVYAAEDTQRAGADGGAAAEGRAVRAGAIGRASCRERV